MVGTAERAAIDSATKAKEQCREDHYREIISSYGLSSTEDLVDTLKTQIEKLLDLNSSSEEIVEALRESDAVTAENVELFVNLYATAAMHRNCEAQLRAMRDGLLELIPAAAWDGFSPMTLSC